MVRQLCLLQDYLYSIFPLYLSVVAHIGPHHNIILKMETVLTNIVQCKADSHSSPLLSIPQERDNEKLQPLELLMKQYVRALEYCPESEPN